jgi:hypothetical protein
MTRPGGSNLVNESAVEARRLADRLEVLERMNEVSREDGSSIDLGLGDSLLDVSTVDLLDQPMIRKIRDGLGLRGGNLQP